ncbi:hypothetical protein ACH4C6_07535 [Streptomyces sp. NPDC017943]|uniref:hypothetical protein n=1 Tax=Streptomyces sp. NPDC017943 TaxID=3365019 RepID=UPI0037AC65C6
MSTNRIINARRVVADALWSWWITTDPVKPFDPDALAAHIDQHLYACGLTIAPDLRKHRMPTRRAIAGAALIALLCAGSAIACAARGEWWWAATGSAATVFITREAARDYTTRRLTNLHTRQKGATR